MNDIVYSKKHENNMLNVIKCLMAIFVLALHVPAFGEYSKFLSPLYRCAVPYFFVIGSYFFWKKYNIAPNYSTLFNYIKRNIQLYIFWFIFSLPLCILLGRYTFFDERGFIFVIKNWIIKIFFGSTWMASWYIQATIIGTVIIYFLSKILKLNTIIIISGFCYLLCCLSSSYLGLLSKDNIIFQLNQSASLTGTFLASMLWISIGKWFAEGHTFLLKNKIKVLTIIVSFFMLIIENLLTIYFKLQITSDEFLFLIPVIWIGTDIILNMQNEKYFSLKIQGKLLRTFSTLVYCSQCILIPTVTFCINYLFEMNGLMKNLSIFVIILVIDIFITWIVSFLEKRNIFSILKYSH